MLQSRSAALQAGAQPVPHHVKASLKPFFDEATLDGARWTVTADRWSLDSIITAVAPRYKAITLGDTIVFQSRADANNVGLWTHELLHVEQVRRAGGIGRFVRAYLGSWSKIEDDTVRNTNRILAEIGAPVRQGPRTVTRACR